jgi:drug/metabolite transporter (DMT)-like permease
MGSFHLIPLGFAALMAVIDAFALSLLKKISTKAVSFSFMPIAAIIYAIQPFVFLEALNFESMTVMNILWDLTSDIIVTFIGIFVLGEQIGFRKSVGIVLSFIAIYLFTFEDGHSPLEKFMANACNFRPANI